MSTVVLTRECLLARFGAGRFRCHGSIVPVMAERVNIGNGLDLCHKRLIIKGCRISCLTLLCASRLLRHFRSSIHRLRLYMRSIIIADSRSSCLLVVRAPFIRRFRPAVAKRAEHGSLHIGIRLPIVGCRRCIRHRAILRTGRSHRLGRYDGRNLFGLGRIRIHCKYGSRRTVIIRPVPAGQLIGDLMRALILMFPDIVGFAVVEAFARSSLPGCRRVLRKIDSVVEPRSIQRNTCIGDIRPRLHRLIRRSGLRRRRAELHLSGLAAARDVRTA